jgi:hydrogenase maturation protease
MKKHSQGLEPWRTTLLEAMDVDGGLVDMLGVGNPIRRDDGVGLEIISLLRSRLGRRPRGLRIHGPSAMPERLLSRLASEAGRVVVFDAVDAAMQPGEIICRKLSETKYGFFATHNIPLRLVPGLAERQEDFYIVGVQPESLEVGEGLTDSVLGSANKIVAFVSQAVGARK